MTSRREAAAGTSFMYIQNFTEFVRKVEIIHPSTDFFPITVFSLNVCACVHVDAKHAKGDVSISTKPRVNLKVRAGVIHAHDNNTDCWVVNFLIRYALISSKKNHSSAKVKPFHEIIYL